MLTSSGATPRDLLRRSLSAEVSAGIFTMALQHASRAAQGAADLGRPAGEHRRPLAGICRVRVVLGKNPSGRHAAVFRVVRDLLGSSWGSLGAILGPPGEVLGHLGAVSGRLGAILGRSWAVLGSLGAILAPSWAVKSAILGGLGASWGDLGASGEALGASWGDLGAVLGPLGATWGSSWSSRRRS